MSRSSIASTLLNALVLLLAVLVLLGPDGELTKRWEAWQDRRQLAALIGDVWPEIRTTALPLSPDRDLLPTVVEVVDYECPFCRQVHRDVEQALSAAPGQVGILHLPLSDIHPAAEWAARVAICAAEQESFPATHAYLMEDETWRDLQDVRRLVQASDRLDVELLETCVGSLRIDKVLESHRALVSELGIRGTPTFITARFASSGSVPTSTLVDWLSR